MTASERAKDFFKDKWNCAQAVSKAVLSYFDISEKQIDFLTTATSALGGGVAGTGHICGALSGGALSIGVIGTIKTGESVSFGFNSPSPIKELGRMLVTDFREKFGSCDCKNLQPCSFGSEEEKRKCREANTEEQDCYELVGWTTARVIGLLEEGVG